MSRSAGGGGGEGVVNHPMHWKLRHIFFIISDRNKSAFLEVVELMKGDIKFLSFMSVCLQRVTGRFG